MSKQILGIHHITAIATDPQANVNFYAGLLGLRLVKLTVNFDDPTTYHLYYGDAVGTPGTILTFFPWLGARRGRQGTGQVTETAFAVPAGSLPYWADRLGKHGVDFRRPVPRFGEHLLSFIDPDGLRVELIEAKNISANKAYKAGPVPVDSAIHGFHSATLTEKEYQKTAALMTDVLGFRLLGQEGNRFRYAISSEEPANIVDILSAPEEPVGLIAAGTVHHIAWRTPSDQQQLEWLDEIGPLGYDVTPVIDRKYFHSIYFREPGSILFEIATDPPGFSVDEPIEELGTHLVLPQWLEASRARLQSVLPRITLPGAPHTL